MKKVLLDSNIIIYTATDESGNLITYLSDKDLHASALSYVEVLGFQRLNEEDKSYFEEFFENIVVLPIDEKVIRKATQLKQNQRIALADSIIAATALEHNLTLVSRNVKDFDKIENLALKNPFE